MARRRNKSPADDLFALIAKAPWWVGVALAVVSHLWLRQVAAQALVAPTQAGQVGGFAVQAVLRTLASVGQYLLPLICLVAAVASAWRRRQAQQLVGQVVNSPAAEVLNGMSWQQFEQLVGEGFRLKGYRVLESGGGGPDGGVDLVLSRGNERFLVQCKQWRAFKVGVEVVRELYGVMAARGAAGGFVVTSGRFTADAQAFAHGRNIDLLDGPQLHSLIQQAQRSAPDRAPVAPSAAVPGRPAEGLPLQRSASAPPPAQPATAVPACPVCAQAMVLRTAKRGAAAGNSFWGCTAFPACRGTRPVG